MKKTVLGLAVLSAVVFSHTVSAQQYDDRWYISGTAGVLGTDNERSVSNAGLFGVGIGKRFAPNMALDVQFDQSSPVADIDPFGPDLTWKMQSVRAVARYYFQKEGRNWSPFIAGGLGVQRHREQYPDPGNGGSSDINTRVGDDFIATLGAGFETERNKRVDYRIEAGLRYDNDQFEEDDNGQPTATAAIWISMRLLLFW